MVLDVLQPNLYNPWKKIIVDQAQLFRVKWFYTVASSVGRDIISIFDAGYVDLKIMLYNDIEGYWFYR